MQTERHPKYPWLERPVTRREPGDRPLAWGAGEVIGGLLALAAIAALFIAMIAYAHRSDRLAACYHTHGYMADECVKAGAK